jgi:hypothetical protein
MSLPLRTSDGIYRAVPPDTHGGLSTEDAMAKDANVNLLLWCARERESLIQQLESLKVGRLQILEMDEAGLRDISGRTIARLTANVAELDKVLAEYDASRDHQA